MSFAISCKNFQFRIKENQILRGINFDLANGGYLSIIGPNGAGKSTFLKCLLRLHEYGKSAGEIYINGRKQSAYSQRELASALAYVPQAGGNIPPFTVMEFLRLSRYPYHFIKRAFNAEDKEAIEEALQLTNTMALSEKQLASLSGGERQRCFLAAALAQSADILLLDEPASFLDPRHASELNNLLRMLNQERGKTIAAVTHDLNQPLAAGGKALVIADGRQLFYGDALDMPRLGTLEQAFQHSFTHLKHPATGKPVVLAD